MKRLLALLMLPICGIMFLFPACALEYGNEIALVDALTSDRVHLRAAPSTGAASLGLYYSGTETVLLGLDAEWAHIRIGTEEGYMMRRYLRIATVAPLQIQVPYEVNTLESFIFFHKSTLIIHLAIEFT